MQGCGSKAPTQGCGSKAPTQGVWQQCTHTRGMAVGRVFNICVKVCPYLNHAGIRLGDMPDADALSAVNRISNPPPLIHDTAALSASISKGGINWIPPAPATSSQTVASAPGLPAISKKLADNILAGNFIDFLELPPAKGRCKLLPAMEGQLILVQAADLLQTKWLITDLATWSQCFAIYTAIVTLRYPERMPSLMAYLTIVAKASMRYKWPSWVVYDLNFHQNAADTGSTDWSKIDPGLYAECFKGMAIASEGWCSYCYSTEHTSEHCLLKPISKKRPATSLPPPPKRQEQGQGQASTSTDAPIQISRKFNFFNGDCSYGNACKFLQSCDLRKQPGHPRAQCSNMKGRGAPLV